MKLLKWFKKADLHQVKNSTSFNRYPEIFSATGEYFQNKNLSNPSILSYGCSTGEECFSLRNYFPKAVIIGLDIDTKNIEIAKSKNTDSKIHFLKSSYRNLNKSGKYDLIFCMSVFCRWPDSKDVEDISALYPFANFETALLEMDSFLNPGGLLVLYNTNFRFGDTSLSSRYQVLGSDKITESGFVHKFGTDNRKLTAQQYAECIFIKLHDKG